MSNGQGGGRNPPPDDRTLLDPLSTDELKALREARQRMQAKKGGGGGAGIVIGPDQGEDIGDAPTRAMPALPSFDGGGVSLDNISTNANAPLPDPANRAGGPPSEPMSQAGTQPAGPPNPTKPGQGGFGENTLLWMQPPKPPPDVKVGGNTQDILPKVDKKEAAKRKLKTYGAVAVMALVVGALLFVMLRPQEKGVLELHTTPPKANVTINGRSSSEVTPMKLTLPEGEHELKIELEGHAPQTLNIVIAADKTQTKELDLEPISQAGMLTVSINVQPVQANITLDDTVHAGKRKLKIANVDPKKPHKIIVEAGGYVKIEQQIDAGQLKPDYTFVLQKEDAE